MVPGLPLLSGLELSITLLLVVGIVPESTHVLVENVQRLGRREASVFLFGLKFGMGVQLLPRFDPLRFGGQVECAENVTDTRYSSIVVTLALVFGGFLQIKQVIVEQASFLGFVVGGAKDGLSL